jgi:hypothetical protein
VNGLDHKYKDKYRRKSKIDYDYLHKDDDIYKERYLIKENNNKTFIIGKYSQHTFIN